MKVPPHQTLGKQHFFKFVLFSLLQIFSTVIRRFCAFLAAAFWFFLFEFLKLYLHLFFFRIFIFKIEFKKLQNVFFFNGRKMN